MTYNNLGNLNNARITGYISIDIWFHSTIASLYGESNRYKESEAMFKKSLAMNPNYVEAYFNLGKLNKSNLYTTGFTLYIDLIMMFGLW